MGKLPPEKIDRYVDYLFKDLTEKQIPGSQNHTLIYGNTENSFEILNKLYSLANKRKEFLCTMHDASEINTAFDFFKPILKAKYKKKYKKYLEEKEWFQETIKDPNSREVFSLSEYCGMDKNSGDFYMKKLPLIFIKGMENLLFKIDYGHLSQKDIKKILTKSYMDRPVSRGFGNHLRGNLHQAQKGIFIGTVENADGIEFKTTLGNYHYLFYADNFRNLHISEN